jgi:hypothetical protein
MSLPLVIDRRFKLTEERAEKICAAISEGHTRAYAAGYAGISERSLYNYLQMADESLAKFEDGDELTEPEAFLAQFALGLQIARGTAEKKYLDIIKKAAGTQWQAAAWIMERSLGWTKTAKVEHTGERVLKVKLTMEKPAGAQILDNAPDEPQDEIPDADFELLGDEDEEHAA